MEYKEIKIFLHTNLEELEEDKRTILFESSKLVHPELKTKSGLKKYPSVSFRVRQNYSALTELDFSQKMQFFFNTRSHLSLLRIYPNLFEKQPKKYSENNPTEFFKEYNEIIKTNIMSMLQLLFVASPLNSISVTSSWEFVIEKMSVPSLPSVYGFFRGVNHNSMLDVNGKQYSFDRLVWMNDVLNCPVYSELFIKYREFIRWRNNEVQKLEATARVNKDEIPDLNNVIAALEILSADYEKLILKYRETPRTRDDPTFTLLDGALIRPFYNIRFLINYLKKYLQNGEVTGPDIVQLHDEAGAELNQTVLNDPKFNYTDATTAIASYKLRSSSSLFPDDASDLVHVFELLLGYKPPTNSVPSEIAQRKKTDLFTGKIPDWKFALVSSEFNRLQPDLEKIRKAIDVFVKLQASGNKNSDTVRRRIEILNDLLNKSYDNIRAEYQSVGRERDAQYSYFIEQYVRSRLSYANKSTNTLLQNLINLQTDQETKRFFQFLGRAFEYFYEGKGEPFRDGEEDADLLYCGVNSKYEGNNLTPIYEIHVLCDLYFGPTGKLYGKQNCGQKGQELGKNLELVLTQNVETLEKNRQKWDLNYRRIMQTSSDSGAAEKKAGPNLDQGQTNKNPTGKPGPQPASSKPQNLNTNLFQEIVEAASEAKKKAPSPTTNSAHWEPDNSVSCLDAINSYHRQFNLLKNNDDFTKENTLSILKKSKEPDERTLYDLFVEYNNSLFQFSQKLASKLLRQISIYESTIKQAQEQQDERIRVNPSTKNDLSYTKLSLTSEKAYFLKNIAEEMLAREKKKPKLSVLTNESLSRGGRSKRTKTKKRRMLNKKKGVTYKNINFMP